MAGLLDWPFGFISKRSTGFGKAGLEISRIICLALPDKRFSQLA